MMNTSSTSARLSETWECFFLPDSGAFFINYLIVSALFRSHIQLHRISDHLSVLWDMIPAYRYLEDEYKIVHHALQYVLFVFFHWETVKSVIFYVRFEASRIAAQENYSSYCLDR